MLPIFEVKDHLVQTIRSNKVTVVVGETGSGKTTRIPQFLYEAGFAKDGMIGITEPRRIAATSVAEFVAKNLGTQLGDRVGYQIRFDVQSSRRTAIKFMTDGILLREIQLDPCLSAYSVVMIDEVHERSCNIDFTLGLLKDLLSRRNDLKVVISSATIDSGKFSEYFDNAPIVRISGNVFDVEVVYRDAKSSDVPFEVARQICEIHQGQGPGDILAFMSSKEDISFVIDNLSKLRLDRCLVLPLYGGIPMEDQEKIFTEYPGKRKIIVATNIAETSITIDGIVYVVDSGQIKQNSFHAESGIQSLDVVEHSRSGCDQRKGRAGRTRPGVCYRLYSYENYIRRSEFTEPEIKRKSIAGVVLSMEDIGINNIVDFDFMDPPDRKSFSEAYDTLITLGAIEKRKAKTAITLLGKRMAQFPLDPRLSRMLLEAEKFGCVQEVATIAAFLSVRYIFVRPKDKLSEADVAHSAFRDKRSDLITYLNIWENYVKENYSTKWCYDNFLNARSLYEIRMARKQLFVILEENGVKLSKSSDNDKILKSVVSGLIYNLFMSDYRHGYKSIFRTMYDQAYIHPASALFTNRPVWIVATEVVRTTRTFARNCTQVKIEWLAELLPHLFKAGKIQLVSHTQGEDFVLGIMDIHFNLQRVGQINVSIPLDDARKIQEASIKQAINNKWVRLTFERESDHLKAVGRNIYASIFSDIEEGGTYYCELRGSSPANAFAMFRYIDFEPKPVSRSEAFANLAKAWGATVSQK